MIPTDKSLIECLKTHYDIDVQSLLPLSEGADFNATLFKVRSDQASYFVKVKYGYENDRTVKILELLQRSGIQQILLPIKTVEGHSILHEQYHCLLVYPFIEGTNGFNQKLSDKQWIMLGEALRQVHDFHVPPEFLKQIQHETYPSKSREFVRSLYSDMNGSDSVTIDFIKFLNEHKLLILQLVDRAEQLCDLVKEQPSKFVLCHSDIHGGNTLLAGSDSIYMIDWDELIMAPKERDLMFIGGGVGNVWNDPHEERLFYEGYGATRLDISILAYYRLERIIVDIAEFAQILLMSNSNKTEKYRQEVYRQFTGMFDTLGVVDIALSTVQKLQN